jgi:hypothetical protein
VAREWRTPAAGSRQLRAADVRRRRRRGAPVAPHNPGPAGAEARGDAPRGLFRSSGGQRARAQPCRLRRAARPRG